MKIPLYAAAVAVFSGIAHANDVGSRVLSAQQERQSFPEVAIMVLVGLALLGLRATIRWRSRT